MINKTNLCLHLFIQKYLLSTYYMLCSRISKYSEPNKALLHSTYCHRELKNKHMEMSHVLWRLVRWKRAQQGKVQKVTTRRSREGDILHGRVKENLSDKVIFEHNLKWGEWSTRGLGNSKYKGPEVVLAPFQRKNKLCKSLMIFNSISISY